MLALALAAGARVIWATAMIPGAYAGVRAGISPSRYLLVQGAVICRYLQLVVAPYGFTVDPDIHVSLWVAIAAWVLLVGATLWLLRRGRDCATWWIAGLILLVPSSSVFPAADVSADRRMYLPMFAFAAAAGLFLVSPARGPPAAGGRAAGPPPCWPPSRSCWRDSACSGLWCG